ncbi:MAG: hypothetical protein QW175_05395 [Candidatus Bathyarchaeia archaeon]
MVRIRLALKEPISVEQNITGTTEDYTAGEEKTKFSVSGAGVIRTVVQGDGDAACIVRFYVDGTRITENDSPSNEPAEVNCAFSTSLVIKTYAESAGSYKHSTLNIYGWRK